MAPPHIIKLTVNGDRVTADPNPAPGKGNRVNPGDLVTWVYDPALELQVVFSKVSELPLGNPPEDISPYGPFNSLNVVIGGGQTFGTIRADIPTDKNRRYFCKIFKDGKELLWIGPVGGSPDQATGGGLDIPMTPG